MILLHYEYIINLTVDTFFFLSNFSLFSFVYRMLPHMIINKTVREPPANSRIRKPVGNYRSKSAYDEPRALIVDFLN